MTKAMSKTIRKKANHINKPLSNASYVLQNLGLIQTPRKGKTKKDN